MSCSLADSPYRRRLLEDERQRLFTPRGPGARYGAEVELLALDAEDGGPSPISRTLELLRRHGEPRGWRAVPGPHGVPALHLPDGGQVAFEPGGQVEYATPPRATPMAVADELARILPPLVEDAAAAGIRLVGRGIDPGTPLERARLFLPGERYEAMHRYLSRIGDAGPRMMLQTAAIQVNVELTDAAGGDGALRWRTLHGAAPYLTAIFANSAAYGGRDSGFASYRARQWRLLDRRRTGVLGRESDAAAEYTDFALEAGWIFGSGEREPEPFVEGLLRGETSLADWHGHLTTLFPEVRPRGYLEVRSIDALPPEWAAVPLAVVAGALADPAALRGTAEIVGAPDSARLQDAARHGLRDPGLAAGGVELFRHALEAGERTGVLEGRALTAAWSYFETYTARGLAPADEGVDQAA